MPLRRCLGVDGAGHRADGQTCGTLTHATRCTDCAPAHETQRTRTRRTTRPYTAQERDRRRAAVDAWVETNGTLCPGWRRDPHLVDRADLTAEHEHAVAAGGDERQPLAVLCRSCNSAKGSR